MKRFIILAGMLLVASEIQGDTTAPRPNVIMIVCDDLNDYVSGLDGHPQAATPHMSRLARSGVLFKRAYSNNPVCAPSRASFLTGIYPHTSLNLFWDKWYENPVLRNSKTLMEHFRDNGYHVAGTGKMMHHHRPEEWSEFKNETDYGPYWFNGTERWSHPSVPEPFGAIGPIDGSFAALGPVPEGQPANAGWKYHWGQEQLLDFSDDTSRDLTPDERNTEWAIGKIKQLERQTTRQPFFLGIGFVRPHTPLHVPQEYFDRFPEDQLQLPALKKGDNADVGFTAELFPESKGLRYFRLLAESYPGDKEGLKAFLRAYLASVAAVDDCIGRVLDALDRSRFRTNTIVVVTSDHGWNMGQKDYLFKNSLWEESTRVPLIIRAPGISKPGGIAEHPVSLIDLYPTLVDLCGLQGDTRKNEQGAPLDGHSVRPFLEDPESGKWSGPDAALTMIFAGGEAAPQYNKDAFMQHWSLRSERYRYIRYNNGFEELYDHDNDPHEWNNVAGHPEYALVKKQLRRELDALLPSKEESASRAKRADARGATRWKDKYFALHPDADSNGDGTLSWKEFQAHKANADAEKK